MYEFGWEEYIEIIERERDVGFGLWAFSSIVPWELPWVFLKELKKRPFDGLLAWNFVGV